MNRGLRKELSVIAGLASAGLLLGRRNTLGAIMGLCALGLGFLPSKAFSFQDKAVLITGGSRGLGFALAENFLREGAFVTVLARDTEELEHARTLLPEAGDRLLTIPCDVTNRTELEQAFKRCEEQFGRIDVLVNNAGSISVGPFESMDPEDFEAQLDLHLRAAIDTIILAIPAFRRVGEGRIANISSIGGELPVPHMTPYCASKFALAGFSEAITAELAPLNIKVTTVYPGMMRTGSTIQAVFKGDHEKEYGWFQAGNLLPGLSVSAETAAKNIIEGIRHGDTQVSYPFATKVGIMGHAVFPETYALFARQAARMMPKGTSHERKTGAASQAWLEKQLWYKPFRRIEENAEKQLNQAEKFDANYNMGI